MDYKPKHSVAGKWPFSLEGTLGWAGAGFCAAMPQIAPQLMILWYALAFVCLFAILDASWRFFLGERAGHHRMQRIGLIITQNQEVAAEPTRRHQAVIAGVSISILAAIGIVNQRLAESKKTPLAATEPPNSEVPRKKDNPPLAHHRIEREFPPRTLNSNDKRILDRLVAKYPDPRWKLGCNMIAPGSDEATKFSEQIKGYLGSKNKYFINGICSMVAGSPNLGPRGWGQVIDTDKIHPGYLDTVEISSEWGR
jgi:hypothetical protein